MTWYSFNSNPEKFLWLTDKLVYEFAVLDWQGKPVHTWHSNVFLWECYTCTKYLNVYADTYTKGESYHRLTSEVMKYVLCY